MTELTQALAEKRAEQARLTLLVTGYGIHLYADDLGRANLPVSVCDDVERLRGRLVEIIVELDRIARRVAP